MEDRLALSSELQQSHEHATTSDDRRSRGQVFTPPEVARFMAGLLARPGDELAVLDPGAGVGTLAAAVCERVSQLRRPRSLTLYLYETDESVLPLLRKNMLHWKRYLADCGHALWFTIHDADFPLTCGEAVDGPGLFDQAIPPVDAVIMNPPYFKIHSSTRYAQLMKRFGQGQPNMYALFMAVSAALLKPGGELVAITPRSFCNGLYFKSFRRWFLQQMSLEHMHTFSSRSATFRESKVLQESVITRSRKAAQGRTVEITVSKGREQLDDRRHLTVPAREVIDDRHGELFVRLPDSEEQRRIVRVVDGWETTFHERGLRVSTGPVVAFRARDFITDKVSTSNSVPYLLVNGVHAFQTRWPASESKPSGFRACPESRSLLLPVRNYVLLRRFSAKEDRRRLTASCFLAQDFPYEYVAVENHLNYIYHESRCLTVDEVYGIAALLNSRLLDQYFRALSGNTQVNATELRTIPFPPLSVLKSLGASVRRLSALTLDAIEPAVLDQFEINRSVRRALMSETS